MINQIKYYTSYYYYYYKLVIKTLDFNKYFFLYYFECFQIVIQYSNSTNQLTNNGFIHYIRYTQKDHNKNKV